jgi:hypothetical protein
MPKLATLSKFAFLASFVLAVGTLSAENPTGTEVMAKHFRAAKPKTTVMTLSMVISKNGQTLSRTLTHYATGDNTKGEIEKSVMKFLAPANVKGSGFMSLKKVDGSTESLLWLPAMGKVRRLSASKSDQDSAFFGSDFTNRDISGFIEADFTYEVIGFADSLYSVEAKPKKDLGYEKIIYLIDATDFSSEKVDYYRGGKLVKSQVITYAQVQGYKMPASIVMASSSGSSTELKFSDYKLDTVFNDQMFTERFLKQ